MDSYEWQIETPGGSTVEPACSTCMQTSFDANEVGEYAVSVTVTDDQGRTDTDTLYVTVEPYDPPEVTVDGPSTVTAGTQRTVSVSANATEEPLASVLWHHEGSPHTSERLSADWSATNQTTVTFAEPGVHEINATVVDEKGYQSSDGITVRVVPPEPYLAVSITDINTSVEAGETVVATTRVENVGEATATQLVSLTRNGTTVDSGRVSAPPGSKQTLRLAWNTAGDDDGTYSFVAHTANETDTRYVTVKDSENDGGASSGGGSSDGGSDGGSSNGGSGSNGDNGAPGNGGGGGSIGDGGIGGSGGDGGADAMEGDLDAEIVETEGGDREAVLKVVPPEDVDHDPVEIEPANHDVTFVAEDGTEYNIDGSDDIPDAVLGAEGAQSRQTSTRT
ncbi:PKD domain-containing protein [Halovenus salina]|uniref:CARDB protein n=1 Tax=Halovenus salina TaxID=1510225 RepID=A0ABD5W2P8_9EURY